MDTCSLWRGISMGAGTKADYEPLARHHYRAGMPVAVTRVFAARWEGTKDERRETKDESGGTGMLAGVLVETRPVLNCALRNLALGGRYGGDKRAAARQLNAEITTIARVIVEPRFRGIGVAAALVRQSLAAARTPYVESLASMGRHVGFFEAAGMTRFDRPLPAASARLLAALRHEGRAPADLAELTAPRVSEFLAGELRRFCRCRGTVEAMLAEARRRALSWPAYYLWRNAASSLPPLARPASPGTMPEAFTVFLASAEKAMVVAALRREHPDPSAALRAWARDKLATNEHQ